MYTASISVPTSCASLIRDSSLPHFYLFLLHFLLLFLPNFFYYSSFSSSSFPLPDPPAFSTTPLPIVVSVHTGEEKVVYWCIVGPICLCGFFNRLQIKIWKLSHNNCLLALLPWSCTYMGSAKDDSYSSLEITEFDESTVCQTSGSQSGGWGPWGGHKTQRGGPWDAFQKIKQFKNIL